MLDFRLPHQPRLPSLALQSTLFVRDDEGVAQLEHVELARAIKRVFAAECPIISEAVWAS